MITVDEALSWIFALVGQLDAETVPLGKGAGRVLAADVVAGRDQPPFAASAMDGYALRGAEVRPGARFTVIGEASAGHGSAASVAPGQAMRIFTGAPMPAGSDWVVIQEDTERAGDQITLRAGLSEGSNVRAAGGDFRADDRVAAPRLLRPADLALIAAMNAPELRVTRRPVVAIIATGDELVMPGEVPRADQIIASNSFGLAALVEAAGAEARCLPIARDREEELRAVLAMAEGADLIVTIGGASVGDHDLVGKVAASMGMERSFYKIAMRPGKPLMAGRLNGIPMIGLPGNPVSSMVCGHIFILPAIRAMLGLGAEAPRYRRAMLGVDVEANGARAHYMRARLVEGEGPTRIIPFDRQDSALLSVLTEADALLLRPVDDPARAAGHEVLYLPI